MVQGQRVKGQGHSVRNSLHRFTANMSRFVTYLPRERVEHPPTTRKRIAHGGRIGSTWRLPGALRKTSENNIFTPNKPENPRTSGAKSEWPLSCNAFAIARFLVWFENIVFGRFAKCAWQPPCGAYLPTVRNAHARCGRMLDALTR